MSNEVRNRTSGGTTSRLSKTKADRRAAAKAARRAAAERAARAKRRRQALTNASAGLAVIGVIVGGFVLFGGEADNSGQPQAAPSTAASSPSRAFPPLPANADPALSTKPTVTGGKGELAKLTVTPLIEGAGPAAQAGQRITVNYVGVSYRTGEEFDASWNHSEPFSFQLGTGSVIPGWDQGLVGVKVGSRVQLDIPSDMAYGDNPGGGRPGGPLRFVVDVLAVG